MPRLLFDMGFPTPSAGGGWLGRQYDPFPVARNRMMSKAERIEERTAERKQRRKERNHRHSNHRLGVEKPEDQKHRMGVEKPEDEDEQRGARLHPA